jgi:hypothetical protein
LNVPVSPATAADFMKNEFLKVIRRGFAIWLLIAFAESLHGTARVILLQPVFGDFRARQLAVFTGSLIILAIAYYFVEWIRAADNFQLFIVGGLWVGLTVVFVI